MRIRTVSANNRKRAFEVTLPARSLSFPYAKAVPPPSAKDKVVRVFVDREAGRAAFTYTLQSGMEGTIHVEQVLEYNKDPDYLRDRLLYQIDA